MSNFKPAPIPKTALSEYKLSLSCPPVQGATKPGTLRVSVVKNNPRIDVYTNVPNDRNHGNIRAAMDAETFYVFLGYLDDAINAGPDFKQSINNKNHTFFDGKRSEQASLVSTTHVGRDKEGRVFIAVTAKERPYLKFVLRPTEYHELKGADGQVMSEADTSTRYARGYRELMTQLVANVLDTNYVEPEIKNQDGQGNGKPNYNNGGGNNYNKGGNSNYQKKAPPQNNAGDGWEDEFPM